MNKKRFLIAAVVIVYLVITAYTAWHSYPIAKLLLIPINLGFYVAPIVIIAVIVFKFLSRRNSN